MFFIFLRVLILFSDGVLVPIFHFHFVSILKNREWIDDALPRSMQHEALFFFPKFRSAWTMQLHTYGLGSLSPIVPLPRLNIAWPNCFFFCVFDIFLPLILFVFLRINSYFYTTLKYYLTCILANVHSNSKHKIRGP